jgi:hypothetical protein
MGRDLGSRGDVPILQGEETFVRAEFGADCARLGELLGSWFGLGFGEEGLARGRHAGIQSEIVSVCRVRNS